MRDLNTPFSGAAPAQADTHVLPLVPFLKSAAQQLYGPTGERPLRHGKKPPQWMSLENALSDILENPWPGSTQWSGLDSDAYRPVILNWLKSVGAEQVSVCAKGWWGCTGATFEGYMNNQDTLSTVRIGLASNSSDFFETLWCPLILQNDDDQKIICREGKDGHSLYLQKHVQLEMLDWLITDFENEPYPTSEYKDFFNGQILKDTPYVITDYIDVSLYPDGTPFFVGSDAVQIKPECRAQHMECQWDEGYQQQILRQIAQNTREVGWPDALGWGYFLIPLIRRDC